MSLVTEPDVYAPNRNDNGTYIDYIPNKCIIKNGIKCLCGSRKNQTFYSTSSFKTHLTCQKHRDWIKMKNLEPQNDLKTINEHEKTIKNQHIIINQKDFIINDLQKKNKHLQEKIDSLVTPIHVPIVDLLGIDD